MRYRVLVGLVAVVLAVAGPARTEASGLADDGRVGVVADLQGSVLVQPAGRQRWSPVGPQTVLLPGDQVRTMARGANAAEIRLAGGGSLVLGAGSLVRLDDRGRLHLVRGDAEFAGAVGKPVNVTGPGAFSASVTDAVVLRAKGDATTRLDETPRWLQGYRVSTTDEWMGSLVANVDGRDLPLSVGYHKVSVVIRDQIAVTTIEESFVNATGTVLEGVFSFPLPAGASISGFGMWIGNELVEADIIERQRARQIYEDILRRKKDPGLLEWSGGNLFKASVFPIPKHGEKRIRLRYTQVLPLEGTRVRYRYALRSELLRTNPLRQLQIKVVNHSTAQIESASSPTHDVRVTQTAHDATLEFTAENYTPERDFEVVFDVARTSPLRVVPHRRGDDGYFMLMFAPPDPSAGAWERDLVPEGDPLDLLFIADTSGSMGPADRKAQRAFLEATLALLGPEDQFRLMACDAAVAWPVPERLAVTDENIERALTALDRRFSLGWTDLDMALSEAASKATDGTLVVYIGDGIGTTGDADPVALAQRIKRMRKLNPEGASFHAVATGSAYEEGVLDAIATLGGSARRIDGDAPRAAYAFLSEVAQPPIRDLRVSFTGLRTARVYPERLPSLPAGTQQIVLGRFLPEGGGAQHGKVTVTGELNGKSVQFTADLALDGDETGNSFLPRLWARKHLDALLAEGRTPEIKNEIVAFSERFGIMTPYTSFLVLENDADRERYGVARRVYMRDGERFFTEARTQAATAALREQAKTARAWRLNLRRRMLAEISGLGRGLQAQAVAWGYGGGGGGGWSDSGGGRSALYDAELSTGTWDGGVPGAASATYRGPGGELAESLGDTNGDGIGQGEIPPDSREPMDPPPPPGTPPPMRELDSDFEFSKMRSARESLSRKRAFQTQLGGPRTGGSSVPLDFIAGGKRPRYAYAWLANLLFQRFPALPPPAKRAPDPMQPTWDAETAEALELVSTPLVLPDGVETGVEITFRQGGLGPAEPEDLIANMGRALIGRERWFARIRQLGQPHYERWLTDESGNLTDGIRLGRKRPGTEEDRDDWGPLASRHRVDFALSYAQWSAKIESRDGTLVSIRLTAPKAYGTAEIASVVVTIDTEKRIVLRTDSFSGEKLTSSRRVIDLTLAGGLWWPTNVAIIDADGSEIWRKLATVRELTADAFDAALTKALDGQDDVIFLDVADPDLAAAKQAIHDDQATFADLLTIASDHARFQRWDEAWATWKKARALVEGKPGAEWIALSLYTYSRQGEAFVAHVRRMADALVGSTAPDARAVAWQLHSQTGPFHVNERLELMNALAGVGSGTVTDTTAAEDRWWSTMWSRQRASLLFNSGRRDEAIAIWRNLWEARPQDPQAVLALLNALAQAGRVDEALRVFAELETSGYTWPPYQVQSGFRQLAMVLWNAMRLDDLLMVAERWIDEQPEDWQGYRVRLDALLALERVDECDAWIAARLDGATDAGTDTTARAQLTAAVSTALGEEWTGRWSNAPLDEKWVRRLVDVARRLAFDDTADPNIVAKIVQHHRLRQLGLHRELLAALRDDLTKPEMIESLSVGRLVRLQAWLLWDRNSVDADVWRAVADRVTTRWRDTQDANERRALFGLALGLLDAHEEPAEAVTLLREALEQASATNAPGYAGLLTQRLAQLPWTVALEDEILALIPRSVAEATPDPQKTQTFSSSVRRIADQLLAMRVEAELGPAAEREKLPRTALRAQQKTAQANARRALAARLAAETKTAPELLRPWYEIERICFLAELGEEPVAVEGEAREMLLSIASGADALEWILSERSVLALSYIAVRRNAPEGLAERVVKLLDEHLEIEEKDSARDAALDWRYAIFRLLVALDRPADLETALRSWIVPSQVESRWRIALGYLMAELERLDEAVAEFESVARLDELAEPHYVSLAAWYLVLGDEQRRQDTLERRYRVVDENQLANRLGQEVYRMRRADDGSGVPPDMDDEVLRLIRVLLSKSTSPAGKLYRVRSLYEATKDFRVLASLADGVLGHTPQAVYPFLEASNAILQDVHEEATCDEIRLRLSERMSTTKTDTDRRGLALLMAQVERRAAEVLDQPGPHVELSLRHLKDARKGEWLPGEIRLMASYLASLGKIPHASLADEQLAQLQDLHERTERGSVERLRVAQHRYVTEWAYGHQGVAIDGMSVALDEYRAASGGILPQSVNDVVDQHTGWFEAARKYGAGEARLLAERERQASTARREWYTRRLFTLYVRCLEQGGTVTHGSGAELYRTVRAQMERALAEHSPTFVSEVLDRYCELHEVAHKHAKVQNVAADLIAFSRALLPEILPRFGQQQADRIRRVSNSLRSVAGRLPALTFLVERIEAEPTWYRRRGTDAWNYVSGSMGNWRRELGPKIGPLEPRLLAIVLRELERDLTTQQARGRDLYAWTNRRNFWKAKAVDFADVARRVLHEHPTSVGIQLHTAQYQWNGLQLYPEAIQTLLDADEREVLRENGRWALVQWLQHEKRWPDVLTHSERLVSERPDNLKYALVNIRALHEVGRDDDGRALVDAAHSHFAERTSPRYRGQRADEQLAKVALACTYYTRCVGLFALAIPEYQRLTRARRGGDGHLANMYGELARAHAGLGRFDEAVDAASAAVVVMSNRSDNRAQALGALTKVLKLIPDLPAWTARYEAEAAKTGLDAPVIRRALAAIHLERKEGAPALRHLRVALRHTPDDVHVLSMVIAAAKLVGDDAGTAAAIADSLARVPAQPDLYPQLAVYLRQIDGAEGAERALTGLVDYAPNEADGHRRLAKIRTDSKAYADAAVQWQQVVRIRSLEIQGWLELARAQSRAGDPDAAQTTLDDLLTNDWAAEHRKAIEAVSTEIGAR